MIFTNLMQTYNRYLTSMFVISLLSLAANLILFRNSPFVQATFIASYLAIIGICLLFSREHWSVHLMRFQIYLLVPSFVSIAISTDYFISTYILHYLLFVLTNLICVSELIKRKKYIIVNPELKQCLLAGTILFALLCIASSFASIVAIVIFMLNSLFLFALTTGLLSEPKKKRLAQLSQERLIKIYSGVLLAMVLLQSFIPQQHLIQFVFAVIFITIATNLCFDFRDNKMGFIAVCALLLLNHFLPGKPPAAFDLTLVSLLVLLFHIQDYVLYEIQSPYGELRVSYDYKFNKMTLSNNNIMHGEQLYYGHTKHAPNFWYYGNTNTSGPVYQIFAKCNPKTTHKNVAYLGLGLGALSTYGKEGQDLTFYELNPVVIEIASNKEYFTYLATCKAKLSYVIGDARETLETAPENKYGIILVDVYSGSHIPKYFLTIEAIELYLRKLHKHGVIIIHITTGDRDIDHILKKIADELRLVSYISYVDEATIGDDEEFATTGLFVYKSPASKWHYRLYRVVLNKLFGVKSSTSSRCLSRWVILARKPEDLLGVIENRTWHPLPTNPKQEILTDAAVSYGKATRGVITDQIT